MGKISAARTRLTLNSTVRPCRLGPLTRGSIAHNMEPRTSFQSALRDARGYSGVPSTVSEGPAVGGDAAGPFTFDRVFSFGNQWRNI
jgi:hypothetical protein